MHCLYKLNQLNKYKYKALFKHLLLNPNYINLAFSSCPIKSIYSAKSTYQ